MRPGRLADALLHVEKLELELQALRDSTISPQTKGSISKPKEVRDENALEESTSSASEPLQSSQGVLCDATSTRTNLIRAQQPPADLVISMASLYFRHIHPWFPFLNVQRVCAEMVTADEPALTYLALFGAALPFSYDSRLDKKSSDAYWKYSKRRILLEAIEEPSYNSLEALTILALDISGMTHGPQVWGPIAVAIKHAVHLRSVRGQVLRTSAGKSDCDPPSDVESVYRERLFWAIYALDCYVVITTAQKSGLSDDHVEYFLGTRDSVWGEPSSTSLTADTVFRYQLGLCDLSRHIHSLYLQYIELREGGQDILAWFGQFQDISASLTDWTVRSLPDSMRLHPSRSTMTRDVSLLAMLHLFTHGLTIHLHGLMAYPGIDALDSPAYEGARAENRNCCLLSIETMTKILAHLTGQTTDRLPWPAAWSAWVASRYLLVEASYGAQLKTDFYNVLSQFIDKMSSHWQIVCKYRWLLRRAVTELAPNGMPSYVQRRTSVLASLRDFSNPTSDLEDHFRADPMLLTKILSNPDISADLASTTDQSGSDPLSGFAGAPDTMSDTEYVLSGPACDQWFAMPLFASSAHEPHDFMCLSEFQLQRI